MVNSQYELVRSSEILKRQDIVLKTVALPDPDLATNSWTNDKSVDILMYILDIVAFYEGKVGLAGNRSAKEAMRGVAKEIEINGLQKTKIRREMEPPYVHVLSNRVHILTIKVVNDRKMFSGLPGLRVWMGWH